MVSREEAAALLRLAREAVVRAASGGEAPGIPDDPVFSLRGGAFVTLKKDGRLRGCIGSFTGTGSLGATIRAMAREAAVGDPRFRPVTPGETGSLVLEISLLSAMKTASPGEVVPGVHGVYVRRGNRAGTLLPQVAVEEGWDRETFLAHACLKAGLQPGAFRDDATELFVYTAQIIRETEEIEP
jgi:AmmeMemoRadiSam system protein A